MKQHQRTLLSSIALVILSPYILMGAENALHTAVISELKNQAKLFESKDKVRAAVEKDVITGNKALRTERASRAELEFNDKSIARLGANTVFSFKPESRELTLEKGTLLFQVPKGRGRTQIATPAATCAITGTTVLLQHVVLADGTTRSIFIVLEGSLTVEKDGETFELAAGHGLILPKGKGKPVKTQVDIASLMTSSGLITDFPELASFDLIKEVIRSQQGFDISSLDETLDLVESTQNTPPDFPRDTPFDRPQQDLTPSVPTSPIIIASGY
jgi:hypothetical protein